MSTLVDQSMVFVVDDESTVREAMVDMLHSVGLSAKAFSSAIDFLRFDRPDVPSCLVLDVRLPEMSGMDVQEELNKSDESPPVIFISGYGDVPMSVQALKAGAVDFLCKPFREEVLLRAV